MEQSYKSSVNELNEVVSETGKQLDMMRGILGVWTDNKARSSARHTMSSIPQSRLQVAALKAARQVAVESTRSMLRDREDVKGGGEREKEKEKEEEEELPLKPKNAFT